MRAASARHAPLGAPTLNAGAHWNRPLRTASRRNKVNGGLIVCFGSQVNGKRR